MYPGGIVEVAPSEILCLLYRLQLGFQAMGFGVLDSPSLDSVLEALVAITMAQIPL